MTLREAVEVLVLGDGRKLAGALGRKHTLFHEDDDSAFNRGLSRLVEIGLLERVARGVYLNRAAPPMGLQGLGTVANHLRAGHLTSEPRIRTGGVRFDQPGALGPRSSRPPENTGVYRTRYGDIEFTHTSRLDAEIIRLLVASRDRPPVNAAAEVDEPPALLTAHTAAQRARPGFALDPYFYQSLRVYHKELDQILFQKLAITLAHVRPGRECRRLFPLRSRGRFHHRGARRQRRDPRARQCLSASGLSHLLRSEGNLRGLRLPLSRLGVRTRRHAQVRPGHGTPGGVSIPRHIRSSHVAVRCSRD